MFTYSLFGILLHTCVDGGKYAQAICIYVVVFAIPLRILVTPTKKRIFFPCNRVEHKVAQAPFLIVLAFRFLLHHILTQECLEVIAGTFDAFFL